MVFENHRKSLIQYCERSELRLHFEWKKFIKNAKKCSKNVKPAVKQCYQIIGQKLSKNDKIKNSNETFWLIFKQCAIGPSLASIFRAPKY